MSIGGSFLGSGIGGAFSFGRSLLDDLLGYQWGIYKDDMTTPLFPLGKVMGISNTSSHQVMQAPTESGNFFTYNKVAQPENWQVRLTFEKDPLGLAGDQADVLAKIKTYEEDAKIVFVRMPGYLSTFATLSGHQYERTSRSGCDLLHVTLTLQEVRLYAKTSRIGKVGQSNVREHTGNAPVTPIKQ